MRSPPTSDDVIASPELAILHALAATLIAAERALLAAHPELHYDDLWVETSPSPSATGWIADAMLTQIAGLEASLNRYTAQEQRERARRQHELPF